MCKQFWSLVVGLMAAGAMEISLGSVVWADRGPVTHGEGSEYLGSEKENCPCTSQREDKVIDVSDSEKKPDSDPVVAPASKGA